MTMTSKTSKIPKIPQKIKKIKIEFLSHKPLETYQFGGFLIDLLKMESVFNRSEAQIISLIGNLGAGKTELMKGIAQKLKLKDRITSPTFVIMKQFKIPRQQRFNNFKYLWHIDIYRLQSFSELESLGFKELMADKSNLIFIEWGDKIKKYLPKNTWQIKFKIINKNTRLLQLDYEKSFIN
ncbi:MAG: tRNA threonylcarbamoyladenosine biosynthesis protein TsaE [Parcubacteria group bacterium ADurb.Bin305]|nr:MAG: tRNA threonylcarbamoyladenosine biosynthesis protein TsaE [Parcubacteria group bacterium ADurb.Bin305]